MDIQRAITWLIEHCLGKNLSEGGNNVKIGLICRKGLNVFRSLQ